MECQFCKKEIPGSPCPQCETSVPEGAKYCMECGRFINAVTALDDDGDHGDNSFDFEDRVLCSDGICTGIIVDGRCTECGKELNDV